MRLEGALPGLHPTVPERDFIMPVHDYDWGPGFKAVDGSGVPNKAPFCAETVCGLRPASSSPLPVTLTLGPTPKS